MLIFQPKASPYYSISSSETHHFADIRIDLWASIFAINRPHSKINPVNLCTKSTQSFILNFTSKFKVVHMIIRFFFSNILHYWWRSSKTRKAKFCPIRNSYKQFFTRTNFHMSFHYWVILNIWVRQKEPHTTSNAPRACYFSFIEQKSHSDLFLLNFKW